ncbi:MAG: DNA-binding protein [Chthoniobacteraceae bacterium]|nr:DNA-binding protein [Chthoniobacteraceae bacterium]
MEQARRPNVVGSTIRRLRSAQNLTQETLSARCGVAGYEISRGTLAKIEAEIRGIGDVELFVIAKVLGVKLEELFPKNFATRLKTGEFFAGP